MSLFTNEEGANSRWVLSISEKMKQKMETAQRIELQAENTDYVLLTISYLDWDFPPQKSVSLSRNDAEVAVGLYMLIAGAIVSFTLILILFLR